MIKSIINKTCVELHEFKPTHTERNKNLNEMYIFVYEMVKFWIEMIKARHELINFPLMILILLLAY